MNERTSEPERRAGDVPDAPPVVRPRGRVRQALMCPYCHDSVARSGSLACGRRGCGALYHRECWDECAASYGGCAVYGCGSKRAREVSTAGYLLRLAKLLLAALLFPPKLARRVVESRERGGKSPLTLANEATRGALPSTDESRNGPLKLAMHTALAGVALFVLLLLEKDEWLGRVDSFGWQMLIRIGFIYVVAIFLPYVVALVPALLYYVLKSELTALFRADVERATVLTRLREGKGRK